MIARWPSLAAALVIAALTPAFAMQTKEAGVDWKTYSGFGEDHYSPLDRINESNVVRLGLKWAYDVNDATNVYTAPLEVNGVLYFAPSYAFVHALDARSGKLLWKYDPHVARVAGVKLRGSWGSRGIAYDDGRIFVGTTDGRLIALDAKTGMLLWSVQTTMPGDGRTITGAPWVFNGKVAIGHGGADLAPVRGYVTAYDQKTGKQVWRFTVPGDPAKGFEDNAMKIAAKTWTGNWWKWGGGGAVWNAMAYDPKFNRLYIGTGNGAPWDQKLSSPGGGDDLFVSSIVALDADTGQYVWHYQVNPGDTWDFDAAMDIELADLMIGGKLRSVILDAPKNGFFYVIDRSTGKLISARPFAQVVTWATRIDETTGRPVENPEARYPDGKPVVVSPSTGGAHSAEAMAFSPRTGLVYIPAYEGGLSYRDPPGPLKQWRYMPGLATNPGAVLGPGSPRPSNRLLAWNPVIQRAAWSVPHPGATAGSVTATGGDLVIQGDVTGMIGIYSATTGKRLWAFDAHTGVMAQPIAYMVDGKEYITVIAGWRNPGPSGRTPEWDFYTQKRRVLTFALDAKGSLPDDHTGPLPYRDNPALVLDPKNVAAGGALFARRCSVCHGPALLSGGFAPDLRRASAPLSRDALFSVVHDGLLQDGGMPKFPELSAADIENIRQYIRARARVALSKR